MADISCSVHEYKEISILIENQNKKADKWKFDTYTYLQAIVVLDSDISDSVHEFSVKILSLQL